MNRDVIQNIKFEFIANLNNSFFYFVSFIVDERTVT